MTDISGMPQPVRLARHAMATRFEWVLWGQAPERLRAAGEEALDEVDALESALSRYRELSDIARVNASAAVGPVRVSPSTFRLLERARVLSEATERAFDITVGALLRVWGFVGGTGSRPLPQAVRQARDAAGWHRVRLDASEFSVTFDCPGVELDLGALGKGHALDRALDLLTEAGVPHALLHGGTSSTSLGDWLRTDAHGEWAYPLLGIPYPRRRACSHLLASQRSHIGSNSTTNPSRYPPSGANPSSKVAMNSAMCWIHARANPFVGPDPPRSWGQRLRSPMRCLPPCSFSVLRVGLSLRRTIPVTVASTWSDSLFR